METWPMRRSCGHTRIRREQKGACSQLLGSFTWWILDEGPRPFGRPGPPDPRRIDGWPDSRSDGRSRAARTRRRPSVHRRHRIRRGTDSSSGGRSRDEGCDPLASHEGDRASTRQEALPGSVTASSVCFTASSAVVGSRPATKRPVATTLRSSIWGLRSDLDQHALMPRNCIPGTDETSGCSTMRSWTCISARSNSSPVPCALLSACPAARLPWRTNFAVPLSRFP